MSRNSNKKYKLRLKKKNKKRTPNYRKRSGKIAFGNVARSLKGMNKVFSKSISEIEMNKG